MNIFLNIFIDTIICFIISVILLIYFTKKGIGKIILIIAFFTLFCSLLIIFTLPYDIYVSLKEKYGDNSEDINNIKLKIKDMYKSCFWILFGTGYTILQLLKYYCESGQFTLCKKIKDAIKKYIIYNCIIFGIFGIIYLIAYLIKGEEVNVGILVTNLFNLIFIFVTFFFVGYGFVKIPLYLYKFINKSQRIIFLEYKANKISEKYKEIKNSLENTKELLTILLKDINDNNDKIEENLKNYKVFIEENIKNINIKELIIDKGNIIVDIDKIEKENENNEEGNVVIEEDKKEKNIKNVKELIKLNAELKSNEIQYERLKLLICSLYNEWALLKTIINKLNEEKKNKIELLSNFESENEGFIQINNINNKTLFYYKYIRTPLYILFLILFLILEIEIVISELSLSFFPISVTGIIVYYVKYNLLRKIIIFIHTLFLVLLASYSLIKKKLSEKLLIFRAHQIDSSTLLNLEMSLSRISFPICLNIIEMIFVEDKDGNKSIMEQNFGNEIGINVFKYIGKFLPITLVIFIIFNAFNICQRIKNCKGKSSSFTFKSEKRDREIEKGHYFLIKLNKISFGVPLNVEDLEKKDSLKLL